MNYYIEELNDINSTDWIRLCEEREDGSFFHTLQWKQILEQSYGFKTHCFLLYRNDEPVALCPFYEGTISRIRGLISLPNSDYNHIIITDENDPLIAYHILEKCKEIAKENKLFFILITTLSELTKEHFSKYNPLPYPIGGDMTLNLEEYSPDKIWKEKLSKTHRKYIKRFDNDGFIIKEINSIEDIKEFYKYYKKNIEFKKANPYLFSHFEDLLNTYSSEEMKLTLLCKNEIVAGGQLAFLYSSRKTMYLRYLSLNRNLPSRYHPTLYLYWDCIKRASEMGYNRVCFGRTPPYPNDVHYKVKDRFGCYYEKEFSLIFSSSYLFKISYNTYYNIYNYMQKYIHNNSMDE